MLQHQSIATLGLYPGGSPLDIALGGMAYFDEDISVPGGDPPRFSYSGSGGMGGYSVMRRKPIKDSPFKQKDGSITIMVSFQDQDWHGEYKEIKHSNVAIRTKLKNETALKNPRPTIGIGMNKPVIKINLKDK